MKHYFGIDLGGTYIKGASAQNPDANMNLPKAAYAFGIAALDYRNSVLDY